MMCNDSIKLLHVIDFICIYFVHSNNISPHHQFPQKHLSVQFATSLCHYLLSFKRFKAHSRYLISVDKMGTRKTGDYKTTKAEIDTPAYWTERISVFLLSSSQI